MASHSFRPPIPALARVDVVPRSPLPKPRQTPEPLPPNPRLGSSPPEPATLVLPLPPPPAPLEVAPEPALAPQRSKIWQRVRKIFSRRA
jgi:hypothetical protein